MNNPLAFADAYFEINSLRVFTATGRWYCGRRGCGTFDRWGTVVVLEEETSSVSHAKLFASRYALTLTSIFAAKPRPKH
jgi:hypothetical protein